jgi:hypothetical protein
MYNVALFTFSHICSFWGPSRPTDPQPKFFSLASLAVLHLLFQNILLLLKVLKALDDIKIFRNITDGENKEMLQDDLENLENWSNTWLLKFHKK